MAALLDASHGFYVSVGSVRKAFEAMQVELGLPGGGESGMKLIRRSMAHLARQRLGERDWIEGQIMLGHRRPSTSDTYAPFDTGYLGRALEVTEAIIEEIDPISTGAFSLPTKDIHNKHRTDNGAALPKTPLSTGRGERIRTSGPCLPKSRAAPISAVLISSFRLCRLERDVNRRS